MKFNPLSKTILPVLRKSLDAYALRHKATAENIVNVDSPKFRPLKVTFEENLQKLLHQNRPVMKASDPRHLSHGDVVDIKEEEASLAGQVNVEEQMAELAKNQIRFEFSARLLARKYQGIRASIIGRSG